MLRPCGLKDHRKPDTRPQGPPCLHDHLADCIVDPANNSGTVCELIHNGGSRLRFNETPVTATILNVRRTRHTQAFGAPACKCCCRGMTAVMATPRYRQRALKILADAGPGGCTSEVLRAHGLKFEMLIRLIYDGFATARSEVVNADGQMIKVIHVAITDAGRRAILRRRATRRPWRS